MSTAAMPLTTKISQASSREAKPNILAVKFGDGYEQRIPNGINYKKDVWQVSWENLSTTDKDTVEAVFSTTRMG